MEQHEEKSPGLKWRPRAGGKKVPYWVANDAARKADYPILSMNLEGVPPAELAQRCQLLQAEMQDFLNTGPKRRLDYDGTLGSVFELYFDHEKSPYHKLKYSAKHPYFHYGDRLRRAFGSRKIATLTGLDVLNWHEQIARPDTVDGKRKLGAATTAVYVLTSALAFAEVCGVTDAARLVSAVRALTKAVLDKPKRRKEAPTHEQVTAARKAAHELRRPSLALGYALQFEGAIRQWDVIGQWLPLSDPRPSSVISGGKKWIGPTWANIDADMVMTYTPTKTENTSEATVHADLSMLPMVMEEIARIPPEKRTGPLLVSEHTRVPYTTENYADLWKTIRKRAGIPEAIWNRDLRAGGVTEGSRAGARIEDTAKLAGHSSHRTTAEVYDRDKLEAARRVAKARSERRASDG